MTSWRDSHDAMCFLWYNNIDSRNGETVSSWCDCWVPGILWTKTFAGVGLCVGNRSWVMSHKMPGGLSCNSVQMQMCYRRTRKKFVKKGASTVALWSASNSLVMTLEQMDCSCRLIHDCCSVIAIDCLQAYGKLPAETPVRLWDKNETIKY